MQNVRFNGSDSVYQIRIEVMAKNLIKICNPPMPESVLKTGFKVLTNKGKVFGNYTDFTTIYRIMDDGSVILSNDGSVYDPPVYKVTFSTGNATIIGDFVQMPEKFENLIVPDVVPDENYEFVGWIPEIPVSGELTHDVTFSAQMQYIPTLQEVKESTKAEISTACEQIIHRGVDVEIAGEWEHFSLSTNDQLNLFGKQAQIAAGATQFEYHQDGCPCKYYDLADMQKIINAAMSHVSYHTTYCNALNMWIAGAKTRDEVNDIFYGADVPEQYQSEVLKNYITIMMAEVEAVPDEKLS